MNLFLNPPFIIAILIALSIHEWAHGFVANHLGDPTAKYSGRLTINPIAHLDMMGTLMFLIVGFGWAKPVPVDPTYFKTPKRDMALVALAGPVSNLILAMIAFIGLLLISPDHLAPSAMGLLTDGHGGNVVLILLGQIFASSLFVNLALMAFNLLPIAPLDGSKVLQMFIPYRYEMEYARFMQQGPIILLILILGGMFLGLPVLSTWVFGIVNPILNLMMSVASMIL